MKLGETLPYTSIVHTTTNPAIEAVVELARKRGRLDALKANMERMLEQARTDGNEQAAFDCERTLARIRVRSA